MLFKSDGYFEFVISDYEIFILLISNTMPKDHKLTPRYHHVKISPVAIKPVPASKRSYYAA